MCLIRARALITTPCAHESSIIGNLVDIEWCGDVLAIAAHFFANGTLRSIVREKIAFEAEAVREAYRTIDSGRTIGKIAMLIADE